MYRQRAVLRGWRRRQPRQTTAENHQGQGIDDLLRAAKKIAKSKIACNIGKKALKYWPDIYENLSGKIKDRNLREILDSYSTKKLFRYGSSYGQNKLE